MADVGTCPECEKSVTLGELVFNDWVCPHCGFTPEVIGGGE